MRVRFNNKIYFCTKATHREGSNLILFTNSNGVYSVDIGDSVKADELYFQVLTLGYCDVSNYEYSN